MCWLRTIIGRLRLYEYCATLLNIVDDLKRYWITDNGLQWFKRFSDDWSRFGRVSLKTQLVYTPPSSDVTRKCFVECPDYWQWRAPSTIRDKPLISFANLTTLFLKIRTLIPRLSNDWVIPFNHQQTTFRDPALICICKVKATLLRMHLSTNQSSSISLLTCSKAS